MAVDPITLQVIQARLAGIVQEMQNSLFRTGYSTIIRESQDASCAILNTAGEVVAQHVVLPLHMGAFPPAPRRSSKLTLQPRSNQATLSLSTTPIWAAARMPRTWACSRLSSMRAIGWDSQRTWHIRATWVEPYRAAVQATRGDFSGRASPASGQVYVTPAARQRDRSHDYGE